MSTVNVTESWWFFFAVPIHRGLGDGFVFPYNDYMFNEIVNRAVKQRRAMDFTRYDHSATTTTADYEAERVSSIGSTTHMT